ncbi:glycoside hydrolase family 2 protein [Alsobacter sp. KACC 23698]|uniref:beta-mannosidase n=1 Tax=Alsobacter sp. KACC 23698 TaxID=3149229 RepID=A0AAU7JGS7_9HYPH
MAPRPLDGWELAVTEPGEAASPAHLGRDLDWIPAAAPGTAAAALQASGRWSFEAPVRLHDKDVWFRARLNGSGPDTLRFEGLATLAEVWLDDVRILQSDNMYLAHEVNVDLAGEHVLAVVCRAIAGRVAQTRPRPRWRSAMIAGDGLRSLRTTLLGHMPGWCPPVDVVGPWRPVTRLRRADGVRVLHADLRAVPEGRGGRIVVTLDCDMDAADAPPAVLIGAGAEAPLRWTAPGRLEGEVRLAEVERWAPNGYGAQPLYDVRVRIGESLIGLGRVGFRTIELDAGPDGRGFALRVNGQPVFCRGASWTPPDIVGLQGGADLYRPLLEQARDAGVTMLRVSGVTLYEADAFYELCDEFGILVWQDFMFANLDYPTGDPAFAASVAEEARQFLSRTQASPCLAVLCGGSEIAQQAAMLGYPAEAWSGPLTHEILPAAAAALRPDALYVANSPWGGDLPFCADAGVTHYYGVGAYRRPLEDARRAGVRFASECLAFANLPDAATLERLLPVPAVHHPRWKERTPRDVGASWDFEDVRDHYLGLLYGVEPARLRSEDPERYADLSRAVVAEVMEATFAEWRRPGSPTGGGLVWFWRDLWPGAGWGVIDSTGEPKSAYWALRRAFRPTRVSLTDEGVNGLALHLVNDAPRALDVVVSFACLRDGAVPVARGEARLTLDPGSARTLSSAALLGSFFDVGYAYRFGPPSHDVCVAALADAASGAVIAEAFHFPLGRGSARLPVSIAARAEQDGEGWSLVLSADRLAQSVHIVDQGYRPEDDWFHLAPGREKRVRLRPRSAGQGPPSGRVLAVNASSSFSYRTC